MNDKLLSLLVGIFSILNTIQCLIFDLNETVFIGYEDKFEIYVDVKPGTTSWILINKKNISISLCTITIMVSSLLLYSIHMNRYKGMLCYAVWILIYELTSLSMVLLTNRAIKEQFKELGYLHLIFQIFHMFLHFFCLPFVIKYSYNLYKDLKTISKIGRRKRSSISTADSWPSVGPGMVYRKVT